MTYLELVNNVLRRLRETEVTTVQSTAYSKLIGDIVNDAKRLVEDAWDWKVLNTATFIADIPDVPSASNPGAYQTVQELDIELKGSGLTPKVKKVVMGWEAEQAISAAFINTWRGGGLRTLTQISQDEMVEKYDIGPLELGEPLYWAFSPANSLNVISSSEFGAELTEYQGAYTTGRNASIRVWPLPENGSHYYLKVYTAANNDPLSSDTDILYLPTMPVIHLAVALAARERGETGGTSTQEYFQIANKYLSDAIAQDAGNVPEQTIFYTV